MKRISLLICLLLAVACHAQNGPTPHFAKLSWTQSNSLGIVKNCVYRGGAVGIYTIPALFCSAAPITTYQDNAVVAGITYHYAVTVSDGTQESPFSNDAVAAIPNGLNAPTNLNTSLVGKLRKLPKLPNDWKDENTLAFGGQGIKLTAEVD